MADSPKKPLPAGTLIIRSPRNAERPYFASARAAAQDENISYEAGGLLWYLLSKPDDWEVRIPDLQKKGAGRDKVYSMLKELKENGYITRPCYRNQDGTFTWGDYLVHETPLPEKPDTDKPDTGQPDTAKPEVNTKKRRKQKRDSNKEQSIDGANAADAEAALNKLIGEIIAVWVTGWEGVVSGNPYSNKTNRADAKKLAQRTSLEDIKRYTLALKAPGKKWENARPSWGIWINDMGEWLKKNPAQPDEQAKETDPTEAELEQARQIAERQSKMFGGQT